MNEQVIAMTPEQLAAVPPKPIVKPIEMPAESPAGTAGAGRAARARLDEAALRRPEFREGVAITLADGRAWHFPRPELSDLYFRTGPDGRPALAAGLTFGPEYEDLVEEYLSAEDGAAELKALAALAMDLLSRNYALGPADFRALLRVKRAGDPGEEGNRLMWESISEVALGRGPKLGPMPTG